MSPYGLIALTSVVSCGAWLAPSVRKGFSQLYQPEWPGVLLCLLWLAVGTSTSYASFELARRLSRGRLGPTLDRAAALQRLRPYLILSVIGWVGVSAVLVFLLARFGFAGMLDVVRSGSANSFKDAVYEHYSAGLFSLRYVAIPAGALAVYHLVHRRYRLLGVLNLLALAVVALVSSRLSIVYMTVIAACLLVNSGTVRLPRWQLALAFALLFHVLCALNYSRNIQFYRSIGAGGFYAAGIGEMVTYLGSPFQGFLAAGDQLNRLTDKSEAQSHAITGISAELSTNSAFLELVRAYGVAAYGYLFAACCLGGVLAGLGYAHRHNALGLWYGIALYCFAELWRVNLFGQGIVLTLVLVVFAVAAACLFTRRLRLRLRLPRVRLFARRVRAKRPQADPDPDREESLVGSTGGRRTP